MAKIFQCYVFKAPSGNLQSSSHLHNTLLQSWHTPQNDYWTKQARMHEDAPVEHFQLWTDQVIRLESDASKSKNCWSCLAPQCATITVQPHSPWTSSLESQSLASTFGQTMHLPSGPSSCKYHNAFHSCTNI